MIATACHGAGILIHMIRALIFDCFGVLYQGSRSHLYDIVPQARHAELIDLNHASDYGFISYTDYLAQVSELSGRPSQQLEREFKKAHRRNDALVQAVKNFKSRYKIGLLSNVGPEVMERLFPASEQAELFDAVVLSCDVASVKPHPEMYEKILEQLDVQPHEAIMIDDIAENVAGARAVGMHGVQFVSTAQGLECVNEIIESRRS